jgi:hypothetical protein
MFGGSIACSVAAINMLTSSRIAARSSSPVRMSKEEVDSAQKKYNSMQMSDSFSIAPRLDPHIKATPDFLFKLSEQEKELVKKRYHEERLEMGIVDV